jgi:DNA modification methylase
LEPYYQDDLTTLYHGCCDVIFPRLGFVDAVVTDPPYGIGESSKKSSTRVQKAQPTDYGHFDWDKEAPERWILDMLRSRSKTQIIFGGNYFELPATNCYLVWDKLNTGDFADCEIAWTNLKGAIRRLAYRWNGILQEDMGNKENRLHPTQKPIAVMEWCVSFVKDAQLIVDPFAGSGSTLIAARRAGIKNIGIEKDERYCEIITKTLKGELDRWEKGGRLKPDADSIAQLPLFNNVQTK